jgi:NADH dehydrogenase
VDLGHGAVHAPAGFLGRHVVAALCARGHVVVVGSRDGRRAARLCARLNVRASFRHVRFERLTAAGCWDAMLDDVDVAVNCVGILRERGAATFDRIHHLAPAALAADCARLDVRLIHVSALGLTSVARSRFISSKLRGEQALRDSAAEFTVVRPSLLDDDGGHGARWLRALARLPLHCVPADAVGRIAVLGAGAAGRAIARLCEIGAAYREVDPGGPGLAHVSPFSFGHLELLRRDNVPAVNLLPLLLEAPPRRVGAQISPDPLSIAPQGRPKARAPRPPWASQVV